MRLRHHVTIYIGEPMSGAVLAESLYQRVLELGSAATESRKDRRQTLSRRFVRAAKKNWGAPALADSTGKHLSFGQSLTASILMKKWVHVHCADSQNIGLLLPAAWEERLRKAIMDGIRVLSQTPSR